MKKTVLAAVLALAALPFASYAEDNWLTIQTYESLSGNVSFDIVKKCKGNAEGTVTIPKGVRTIDDRAFWNCSQVTSVVIPEGVMYIGEHAFGDCRRLTSIVIPEGVKVIEEAAFDSCVRLTSVTIPASVKVIEKKAFIYCGRLATINYGGTKVQWADVNKGDDWHRYVPETAVVKCSDGEVELDYIE